MIINSEQEGKYERNLVVDSVGRLREWTNLWPRNKSRIQVITVKTSWMKIHK